MSAAKPKPARTRRAATLQERLQIDALATLHRIKRCAPAARLAQKLKAAIAANPDAAITDNDARRINELAWLNRKLIPAEARPIVNPFAR